MRFDKKINKFISAGVIAFFLILTLNVKPAVAGQILFSDDFSQDFEKWVSARENDQVWEIVDGQARAAIHRPFTIVELIPADEYWDDSWSNYQFEMDYTPIMGVDKNIAFGFEDLGTWYEFHFFGGGYELLALQNGEVTFQEWGSFAIQNNQTYHVSIILEDDHITAQFNDQKVIDTHNPVYIGHYGKISIKASTGTRVPTEVYFDNVTVKTLEDDQTLEVPIFKQNDPSWSEQEYDHASTWNDSEQITIKDWGCALSGMTMILHYHGIDTLPDGGELRPDTLNDWLNLQPDGYIGQGLVNWRAITRLTWLMATELSTPKLEYQWQNFETLEPIITDLKNNLPSLIKTNGHFVVATGITENEDDLYINDPYFEYNFLSEHATPPESSRHFYPSQTDLSYLLITAPLETKINITSQDSQEITNLEVHQESLKTTDHSTQTQPIRIYELAKPNSQTFEVSFSQDDFGTYEFTIYAYNTQGEVEIFEQAGWVGPEGSQLSFFYDKEGLDNYVSLPDVTWVEFQEYLNQLSQNQILKSVWTYQNLTQIGAWAIDHPDQTQLYQQLAKSHLNEYQPYLPNPLKSDLESWLDRLL